MKLQAEVNGKKHEIELTRGDEAVVATIDGRRYEVDSSEPENDVFLLKIQNTVNEARVSPNAGNAYHVRLGTVEFDIKLVDPKRLRGSAAGEDSNSDISEIRTAMPGKVVRIITPSGTEVKKGDPVIVVEAMKMQNEMKSPKDGIVKDIRASEGSTVNAGDVLAVIG